MTNDNGSAGDRVALWTAVAQFTALVAGIAVAMLAELPRLYDLQTDSFTESATKAIAVTLFLFIFVWVRKHAARGKERKLALFSVVLFFASLVSIFGYNVAARAWSCPFPGSEVYVKGSRYTAAAERQRKEHDLQSCSDVMFGFTEGRIAEVWDPGEMLQRYYLLQVWFLISATGTIAALLLGIEAMFKATVRKQE